MTNSSGSPDIGALLNPSNVCIVGASERPGGWPDRIRANLRKHRFSGEIYPVNPRRDQVWGEQCYPDLASLPERPDHALIVIPSQVASAAVTDAIGSGARSATVLSGGFTTAQLTSMRTAVGATPDFALSGPNCLGNISVPARLMTTTEGRLEALKDGPVAIVGQSGGIVMALNRTLAARGVGARYVISSGNETCIATADYIDYFAASEGLRVVLAFVESVRDWPRFEQACRNLRAHGKHLVALKVGQSASSRDAAASHTGALAGSYDAFEAVSARLGVITVDTMEAAVEACEYLSRVPAPRGTSLGVVTISGGVRELLLDAADRKGAVFAELSQETEQALATRVEEESAGNPLDSGYVGISSMEALVDCVAVMGADPSVDAILVQEELLGIPNPKKESGLKLFNASFPGGVDPQSSKPVALFSISTVNVTDFGRALRDSFPNLAFLQGTDWTLQALRAIGRAESQYHAFGADAGKPRPAEPTAVPDLDFSHDELDEVESQELISHYGFTYPAAVTGTSIAEVVAPAGSLRFPVVLKVVSRQLTHKSDAGGVVLNINSTQELETACRQMAVNLPQLEGYLVTTQLPSDRVEIVVGYVRDPEVGPVVVVGRGGVEAELAKDVAIVPVPCSHDEALDAIRRTKLGTLLGGWRGNQPCDIDAVAAAVCNMARLADELRDSVTSAEVNPLAVVPGQSGAWALDALVELRNPR